MSSGPPATREQGRGGRSEQGRPGWLSARRLIQVIGIVVFIGLWVTRLGQSGGTAPSPNQPTTQPAAVVEPLGHAAFGSRAINCEAIGTTATFKAGDPIWWAANLGRNMAPDDKVRIVWLREGASIEEDTGPGGNPSEGWDCLFATSPAHWEATGAYRLEIWSLERTVLLAAGAFTVE